jgi:hypothetical protein
MLIIKILSLGGGINPHIKTSRHADIITIETKVPDSYNPQPEGGSKKI